ncbi:MULTISPECIES: Nmad2 family putative nucleotide modification protein [Pseudomonas]|uniref:Nucleotide modification associated domain-containing protein n=1 Tax=Pseudomonas sp. WC2401 TaxID=3234143 RepID=A0AB39X4W5_9PSED
MNHLPRIYSYKLSRDYGFAPNPFHGICTLATCKPQIRKGAQVGDLIVGCGSKELKMQGKIIFVMRVSEKISFQQYWEDSRFHVKKVDFQSGKSAAYGDNIYHLENGLWVQEDSHHSFEGGVVNADNLSRDIGSDNVLIGEDFVYWGSNAPMMPPNLRNIDGDDLFPNGRNFRSIFSEIFRNEVVTWFSALPERGNLARPTSW